MTTPPPLPTQSPMTDNGGLVSRVWLNWFNFLKQTLGFNQTIQSNGNSFPGETSLNFLSPFTVADNRINGSTDIGITVTPIPPTLQTTFAGVMGTNYQNTTGYDKFVTITAQTSQAPGNNSQFSLQVGPLVGSQVIVSVGNVTNGPGYATASCWVPDGSWYSANNIAGTLAIITNGWQEFSK